MSINNITNENIHGEFYEDKAERMRYMSHTSVDFFVLSIVLASAYVAGDDQALRC